MQIKVVPVTPYQQNCSIIKCNASGKAAVVDPGGEADRIIQAVKDMDATLEKVILTHAHVDHCAAADIIRQGSGVPIEGPHIDDSFWLEKLPEWCRMSGFPPAEPFTPDRWLEEGDEVMVGELVLEVLHCPGHTPGHVVFYHRGQHLAWVGDVLFQGSIGRTDLPRGNHQQLLGSIREKLFPLGDEVRFIPGHGPSSSFGQERRSNPYVGDHIR
jgi:glyoxylase-like metal-dependent hydrolase (beta-lactamase superfamily II)